MIKKPGRVKRVIKKKEAGTLLVRSHFKKKSKNQKEVKLKVQTFDTEVAHVTARYGLTLNLGNFESARCDCYVTLPCYVEEMGGALKEAWEIAEKEVQAQVECIRGDAK